MANIAAIKLVKTCGACPEQYDAYIGEKQVGYLRLRHGYFSVRVPDALGVEVYGTETNGDGMFTDEERESELLNARVAILMTIEEAERG